jgi:1,4-dihydroxy-2-naphthoyl-CoA hydrolase
LTMAFSYLRTIHFPDTDAAGVVFFANYLVICHEAYEEALGAAGIELKAFFADTGTIIPISKSSAEYLRPLQCGDKLTITVKPAQLTPNSFSIDYEMTRMGPPQKLVAHVRTSHVCLDSQTRERKTLPTLIQHWIEGVS